MEGGSRQEERGKRKGKTGREREPRKEAGARKGQGRRGTRGKSDALKYRELGARRWKIECGYV